MNTHIQPLPGAQRPEVRGQRSHPHCVPAIVKSRSPKRPRSQSSGASFPLPLLKVTSPSVLSDPRQVTSLCLSCFTGAVSKTSSGFRAHPCQQKQELGRAEPLSIFLTALKACEDRPRCLSGTGPPARTMPGNIDAGRSLTPPGSDGVPQCGLCLSSGTPALFPVAPDHRTTFLGCSLELLPPSTTGLGGASAGTPAWAMLCCPKLRVPVTREQATEIGTARDWTWRETSGSSMPRAYSPLWTSVYPSGNWGRGESVV
jgi:hypothetical protein